MPAMIDGAEDGGETSLRIMRAKNYPEYDSAGEIRLVMEYHVLPHVLVASQMYLIEF